MERQAARPRPRGARLVMLLVPRLLASEARLASLKVLWRLVPMAT